MAGDWLGLLLHCCLHDDFRDSPDWELQPHLEDVRELQQVHGLLGSRHQEIVSQGSGQPKLPSILAPVQIVKVLAGDAKIVPDSIEQWLGPGTGNIKFPTTRIALALVGAVCKSRACQ